jgi:hypothetical protein
MTSKLTLNRNLPGKQEWANEIQVKKTLYERKKVYMSREN